MKSFAGKYGWLSFMLFLSYWHPVSAKNVNVGQKINTGYLYSLTDLVACPEHIQTTFNVSDLENNPLGKLIDCIESKTAFGRPAKLSTLKKLSTDSTCHLLCVTTFVAANSIPSNALVVGDYGHLLTSEKRDGYTNQDDIISFINSGSKTKLKFNRIKVKQCGFKMSSKLLEVAELIGVRYE